MFSHSEMVHDLIAGFLVPSWSDRLDFSTLTNMSANFVSPDLRSRQADKVWRIRFRDSEQEIFFLTEFQDRDDPLMAARMNTYVALLYDAITQNRASGRPRGELPRIFPVVLSSSLGKWTEVLNIAEMITPGTEVSTWNGEVWLLPSLKYFVLDFKKHPWTELVPDNLVTFLIGLNQKMAFPEELPPVVIGLRKRLRSIGNAELARTFSTWSMEVLMKDDLIDSNLHPLDQMEQIEDAVVNRPFSDWAQPWILEIRAEGRAENHEETLGTIRARLCHQAASKLDPETLERLTNHLDRISDLEPLLEIYDRFSKGETGAELLKCLDDRS